MADKKLNENLSNSTATDKESLNKKQPIKAESVKEVKDESKEIYMFIIF